ncbi:gamma-glutamyltransferase [Tunturiibacter lichenicola]|uniref:gamma-glutamyltransferase n=1 Tax=Tunturiibacter lichenicola TaxID=2051959 RepID=UPI003D9B5109
MPCGNRVLATTVSLALSASSLAAQAPSTSDQPTRTKHAMVVTIHHDATDAGVEILKQGGNAVDAAVAVGFALAVVYPAAGNIGGGGFMLIRDKHGKTHFLDYREKAPAAASRDMYLDAQGNVIPDMSLVGYKASGVPGSVAGLAYAQKHYGKLTLAQDMAPAIKLATVGYTLSIEEARALHSKNLSGFPVSAKIFQRDGNFYREGDTFKQPELAATLNRISKDPDEFYKGAMAHQIADFEKTGGGLITAEDLAAYQVKERVPIRGKYHGFDVITAPPPSSGGIILVEILNILSTYDLPKLGPDRSAAQVHIIAEAFRRAYKDRGDYLGDPDFNTLPIKQMTNLKYAAAWRSSIDPSKPTPSKDLVRPAGFMPPPPQSTPVTEPTQTTHYSIVDADGTAVSTTTTLNGGFGSGVTVQGLGFLMNNEMDDFTSKVGVPNVYGLIQSSANSIGPGKRPLSAMTPTILTTPSHWYKPGKLAYVLGTPGGSTIITTVANNIISTIDNGLNIQQAADAPRFHHQYLPDRIDLEKKFSPDVAEQLAAMGYTINRLAVADEHNPGTWGDSELIAIAPKTHELLGGHDNRRAYGKAAGY